MTEPIHRQRHHLATEVAMIGGLALILSVAIDFIGILAPIESYWAELVQFWQGEIPPPIPAWAAFLYLAAVSLLTPLALLSIRSQLRRLLPWCITGILTVTFSIVLSFCHLWFSPWPPLLGILWAGIGSFIHLAHLKKNNSSEATDEADESEEAQAKQACDSNQTEMEDEWEEFRQKP